MKITLPSSKKPTNNYIWDLYRDGVTQSFINKFLTCRKQCFLEYIEGWTPIKEDNNLHFGTLLHNAIDISLKAGEDVTKAYLATDPLKKELVNDPITKDIFYAQVEVLLECYWIMYIDDFSRKWIKLETEFNVKDKNIPLRGKIDSAFMNNKGGYWLMDNKGLSVITTETLDATLPYDLQMMFYMYAEALSGMVPTGFIYNIIRKPQISTKDIATYKNRLRESISKDMEHYFKRITIPIAQSELKVWRDTVLWPILEDIAIWQDCNFKCYANPAALTTKYHKLCPTFPILTRNDYSMFFQRTNSFRELE